MRNESHNKWSVVIVDKFDRLRHRLDHFSFFIFGSFIHGKYKNIRKSSGMLRYSESPEAGEADAGLGLMKSFEQGVYLSVF